VSDEATVALVSPLETGMKTYSTRNKDTNYILKNEHSLTEEDKINTPEIDNSIKKANTIKTPNPKFIIVEEADRHSTSPVNIQVCN
jgi:hypothetical protein